MTVTEHHIVVPRTARYAMLGTPTAETKSVWFVCHGYAQLAARFILEFEGVEDSSTLIIAPEGLSRMYLRNSAGTVGASWMTREDRLNEIEDYVRYLDAVHDEVMEALRGEDIRVTTLGFSQGTATAGRWIGLGRSLHHRCILAGGLLPPDLPYEAYARLPQPLTYIVGSNDPLIDRAALEEQRTMLASLGVESSLTEFEGGHAIDVATLLTL
ncbi:MAG: phospholipase [Bacteroidetes bacterium]|nr:phospholipase [Bacteroidota bacterium]